MSRLVVAISHVEFTETDQTFYVIRVQQDADEWHVRRAYSDFRVLRDDVQRVLKDERHQLVADDASRAFYKSVHDLPFPPKRLFGSKKDHVVKERAVELHHFLIKLLFATHAYRKAQKHLYDDVEMNLRKPHGSASVFFLLRDFLKPLVAPPASGNHRHARQCVTDDEHSDDHARVLRESRMLNMRTSQQAKAMSAPQLQQQQNHNTTQSNARSRTNTGGSHNPRSINTNANTNANALTPRRAAPPPMPSGPIAPEAVAAVTRSMSRVALEERSIPTATSTTTSSSRPTAEQHHVQFSEAVSKPRSKSASRRTSNASAASATNFSSSAHADSRPRAASRRFNDRISNADFSYPTLRAISSDYDLIATTPDPQPRSLSTSSTASSTASIPGNRPVAANELNDVGSNGSGSSRRRPRRSGAHSSSSLSASASSAMASRELEQRTSERLTRLTPQLTAQTITIDAQKALEKYVSEYNAIMVLRYVDRFIVKAVGKTPGCYTVAGRKLVIDSARFVEELDDVFPDLPASLQLAFKNSAGEWVFPKALDAYVQMKWDSFTSSASTGATDSSRGQGSKSKAKAQRRKKDGRVSDSENDSDSDSEYEFEDTGGFMKKKDRAFTQEESDELQMMIADGTAGRDQILRLRRQFDERGWQRHRAMPSAKSYSNASSMSQDSDTDDDDTGSGNESIKRFQQMQNAMRKSRMSRHDEGGLV